VRAGDLHPGGDYLRSGGGGASRALIKGGAALEQLSQVQHIAFDKTGTLTVGKPQVTGVYPQEISEDELLAWPPPLNRVHHPLAQAIVRSAVARAEHPSGNRPAGAGRVRD
jgi:Cd2+/Zn2+-exporting ATPase